MALGRAAVLETRFSVTLFLRKRGGRKKGCIKALGSRLCVRPRRRGREGISYI